MDTTLSILRTLQIVTGFLGFRYGSKIQLWYWYVWMLTIVKGAPRIKRRALVANSVESPHLGPKGREHGSHLMIAAYQSPQILSAPPSLPWFALRVRSNFEDTSYRALCGTGLEAFLPSVKMRRRWSDRVRVINQPLFPGYVFSRFDPTQRADILRTPGVVHVVSSAGVPLPVAESELNYIRTVVLADLESVPHPFLRTGQWMRIVEGPLTGAEGVITKANGACTLILSISLLQRSIAVKVEPEWLRSL